MTISERDRHDLYLAVERFIGTEPADTMMSMLPPVGWADVATKADLAMLEARIESKIDRALRHMVFAMIASQATMTALVLTAVSLAR